MGKVDGTPNPVDVHVGLRVRLRRKQLGLSQEHLADGLGLTFQQVQKYERGFNRISASKLYEIAKILAAPVSYFFGGLETEASDPPDGAFAGFNSVIEQMLAEPGGQELAEAFVSISNPRLKRALEKLIRAIATDYSDLTAQTEINA